MTGKVLSIVIPVFKEQSNLRLCLKSLYKSTYKNFFIIIVDHGCDDAITQWVKREFPDIICLRGSSDLWWSGATNIGVKYALKQGHDLIMLLNHDCYLRKDTIGNLLSSNNDINKIVAPIQIDIHTKKELVCAYSFFLLGFSTVIPPARWCKSLYSNNLVSTGLIIGGRGVIIDAEVFRSVGLLDEVNLPHYGADHDFYLRCKKSGFKLYTCKTAIVDVDDSVRYSEHTLPDSMGNGIAKNLLDRKSHRNIKDTWTLFSNHFPIPGFAFFGVSLYLLRYFLIFLLSYITGIKGNRNYR